MKRLYLIRHAKSSWKNPGLIDYERPLSGRGKRDAPMMGLRLEKLKVQPDLMITSPAKRARKTAEIIAKEIGYPSEKIVRNENVYQAEVVELLAILRKTDPQHESVMLFGHNPELTELANYLTRDPIDNIPTCGVFCVEFDVKGWPEIREGSGVVKFFDYPKKR